MSFFSFLGVLFFFFFLFFLLHESVHICPFFLSNLRYRKSEERYALGDRLAAQGVRHSDISEKNFLVDDKGKLHIADFGCAELLSSRPESTFRPGLTLEEVLPKNHRHFEQKPSRVQRETRRPVLADVLSLSRLHYGFSPPL